MPKKLLVVSAAFNCGAPGRIVEQTGLLAQANGWQVEGVHGCRHYNTSKLSTLEVTSLIQERCHAIRSYLFDGQGLGGRHYTVGVVEKIKTFNPDVIHLHNIHGYYINYDVLFRYLKEANKPIVWTFHDFWPITGHCVHFYFNGCEKWKTGCHHCKFHTEYPFSIIDKSERNYQLKKNLFTGINDVTLVPVSNWVASKLEDSFLGEYPIKVIHNGVDVDLFHPRDMATKQAFGIKSKYVLLGVASPWSEMKGFDDYMLLRERLSDEYTIVMVGLTHKQIEKLPDGIVGIERTQDQEELANYYSMADVVLNLSYQETFGMTTVEGLACGTPGIVYNRTASPELINDETGKMVEAGDIDGLVSAVQEICLKKKEFYTAACRERAVKCFNKDDCFQAYVDLYEDVIRC